METFYARISTENLWFFGLLSLIFVLYLIKLIVYRVRRDKGSLLMFGRRSYFNMETISAAILALLFIVIGISQTGDVSLDGINYMIYFGLTIVLARLLFFDDFVLKFTSTHLIVWQYRLKKKRLSFDQILRIRISDSVIAIYQSSGDIIQCDLSLSPHRMEVFESLLKQKSIKYVRE